MYVLACDHKKREGMLFVSLCKMVVSIRERERGRDGEEISVCVSVFACCHKKRGKR